MLKVVFYMPFPPLRWPNRLGCKKKVPTWEGMVLQQKQKQFWKLCAKLHNLETCTSTNFEFDQNKNPPTIWLVEKNIRMISTRKLLWGHDLDSYPTPFVVLRLHWLSREAAIFGPGLVFNLNSSKIGSALFYTWAEGSRQFSCFNPDLAITTSWNWLSLTRVSGKPGFFVQIKKYLNTWTFIMIK